MFKYNHDCPFEAYVSNLNAYNEGKIIGAWVKFPADKETIKNHSIFAMVFACPSNLGVFWV